MTKQETLTNFRATTEQLTQLIREFDESTFNRKPDATNWSACEVAEHLLLFDIRLNEVIATSDKPAERDSLEKVPAFTPRVTNLEVKLEAPPFLVPTVDHRSPAEMADKINVQRKKALEAAEQKDFSLISTQFPHRLFGEMTIQEWLVFVDMHTQRHLPQLERLLHN